MTKEQIVNYFNDKYKKGTLTDRDRLFLVGLLYGDLNLIEQLEYMLLEEDELTDEIIEDVKDYIKS